MLGTFVLKGIILFSLLFNAPPPAVDISAEVEKIVAKLPAANKAEGYALMAGLANMGLPAVKEITSLIRPQGQGDDSRARMALQGLVNFVWGPTGSNYREMMETGLLYALDDAKDIEVKTFLISQIQIIGGNRSAVELEKYLEYDSLCDPAVRALISISSIADEAGEIVTRALLRFKDKKLVALINAIIPCRGDPSVKQLVEFAFDQNKDVRLAARRALSLSGDKEAAPVLQKAFTEAKGYDRTQAGIDLLLFSEQIIAQSENIADSNLSKSILRGLIVSFNKPEDGHIVCASLNILVKISGAGAVMDDLLIAADHADKKVRCHALCLAQKAIGPPGALGWDTYLKWEEKMKNSPPHIKAEILSMLGRSKACSDAMLGVSMYAKDKIVRLAAISALADLKGYNVYPGWMLAKLGAADNEEIELLKSRLICMDGPFFLNKVAGVMPDATSEARNAILELLAARNGKRQLESIYYSTSDLELMEKIRKILSTLPDEKAVNLALQKLVTTEASSGQSANPNWVVDGSSRSAWIANKLPCTVIVDLCKVEKIDTVSLFLKSEKNAACRYIIEISVDNKTWSKAVEMIEIDKWTDTSNISHRFSPLQARYVRLKILGTLVGKKAVLSEFKIFEAGRSPEWLEVHEK